MRCEGREMDGQRCVNSAIPPVVVESSFCDAHQDQDGVEVPVAQEEVQPPESESTVADSSEVDAQNRF